MNVHHSNPVCSTIANTEVDGLFFVVSHVIIISINLLISVNNKLKKDIKALQDEVTELKNVFSEDTIAVRLGTILGEEFARKRVSEIMEKLDDLEKKNNLAKNYSQNDLVLAAKYMINQLLKRGLKTSKQFKYTKRKKSMVFFLVVQSLFGRTKTNVTDVIKYNIDKR